MNEGTIRKNIDESMIRINLIADPEYIVGEDKNVHCYLSWMNKCNNLMMGSVVLGQIGNGKTHFASFPEVLNFNAKKNDSRSKN